MCHVLFVVCWLLLVVRCGLFSVWCLLVLFVVVCCLLLDALCCCVLVCVGVCVAFCVLLVALFGCYVSLFVGVVCHALFDVCGLLVVGCCLLSSDRCLLFCS